MKANADLPLVTIQMSTYNQEKYVRESVRGVLAQTYEPLQIVISDDHSTDSTWEIVQEEVDAYRQSGGVHKDIVLNRNSENLGIMRHFQFIATLCKGEIWVCNAGDDISMPNRVERIVDAWRGTKNQVSCVLSGLTLIDESGQVVGTDEKLGISEDSPLGAVAAYDRRVVDCFPGIRHREAYEDVVFVRRALILGEVVKIPDRLVQYRNVGVCSGWVKSGFRVFRERASYCDREGLLQVLEDLEYKKSALTEERYESLKERFSKTEKCLRAEYEMITAPALWLRLARSKTFAECFLGRFNPLTLGYLKAVLPRVLSKRSFDALMFPFRTVRSMVRLFCG